jgi:hypothetical protein
VIDVIGQIGTDPGTEWGTGLASTADNTLRRKAGIEAGDGDGSDAFDPATQWLGFATDTVDGLGCAVRAPASSAIPRLPCLPPHPSRARRTSHATRTSRSRSASPSP